MPRRSNAGRPALPPDEKASARMGINFRPADKATIDRAAKLLGKKKAGQWIGEVALAEAQKVIARRTRAA